VAKDGHIVAMKGE